MSVSAPAPKFLAMLVAGLLAAAPSTAQEWRTTSSLIEDTKYGEDFRHYDYVNPEAPKGGTLNSIATGTFDSFNPFIVRGTAAAGLGNFGGRLYDTLMQQATDEPGTSHALIADAFKYPDDYSSATYRLDPEARWHDGKPITAEDVIWSFEVLKEISPLYGRYYANVTEAVAVGEREVEFRFDQTGNRELPHIMGDLTVLPRHWWEGEDAQGRKRDIRSPTLERPLGSGPYRIGSFRPGSEIVWERVEDYWAAERPVNMGRQNFDRLRFVYFQDENAAWQAFTKGGFQDFRRENSSRRWSTGYDFPAFQSGDVVKREFESTSGHPMQAYVLNQRRPQFQDRRVRQALTHVLDFEGMNRRVFFNLNTRTSSYFQGTELAASGLPEGAELEILKEYEDKLPPELFTEPFKLPVNDTPQAARDNLRRAVELFAEAGWTIRDGRMVNERGEQFTLEYLGATPTDEVIATPFIENLRRIGINASIRMVDTSQYINRERAFEFDVVTDQFAQSLSPGNEQRDFWSTRAADIPGSRNTPGIRNEVVDALVERVVFAKDRDDLVAATRALDRVLQWNYYVIPQWHRPTIWTAYWNKFGIPEKQPSYFGIDIDSWWIDTEKEAALAARYRSQN